MPVRNRQFYDVNETISYPIDDTATSIDDEGQRIPSSIVVDLQIRYPNIYGDFPFISAITVSKKIVTLVVQVATAIEEPYDLIAVAVVTITKPITESRQYALQALVPGVGGWIVFGSGVQEDTLIVRKMSTPSQGLLTPKIARPYKPLPVESVTKLYNATELTGVVSLRASPPLELIKTVRTIDGIIRDVLVFRLSDNATDRSFEKSDQEIELTAGQSIPSVFQNFAGPCGARPESRSCGDPQPFELINSVAPDCDGVITIDIRGCALVAHLEDPCAIVIECNRSLSSLCPDAFVPDSTGRLPVEHDPLSIAPPTPEPEPDPDPSQDTSTGNDLLPFTECFDMSFPVDFTIVAGEWDTVVADTPGDYYCESTSIPIFSLESQSASMWNMVIWQGFDTGTLNRRTVTDFFITTGTTGAKHNASVVLNYKAHPTIDGLFVFYIIEVDYDNVSLRVRRFNGTEFNTVFTTFVPGITLNKWFRLIVDVIAGDNPGETKISAQLKSMDDGSVDTAIGPLVVTNYAPSVGYNGLYTDRAISRFSFFFYDET